MTRSMLVLFNLIALLAVSEMAKATLPKYYTLGRYVSEPNEVSPNDVSYRQRIPEAIAQLKIGRNVWFNEDHAKISEAIKKAYEDDMSNGIDRKIYQALLEISSESIADSNNECPPHLVDLFVNLIPETCELDQVIKSYVIDWGFIKFERCVKSMIEDYESKKDTIKTLKNLDYVFFHTLVEPEAIGDYDVLYDQLTEMGITKPVHDYKEMYERSKEYVENPERFANDGHKLIKEFMVTSLNEFNRAFPKLLNSVAVFLEFDQPSSLPDDLLRMLEYQRLCLPLIRQNDKTEYAIWTKMPENLRPKDKYQKRVEDYRRRW